MFFCFFKQKTAYEMRIRDWSSDVCSSDLVTGAEVGKKGVTLTVEPAAGGAAEKIEADVVLVSIGRRPNTEGLGLDKIGPELNARGQKIGRASCRARVCKYV